MPPMNFAVTEQEVQATIDEMADGKMVQSVLVSNELIYVNHFRYIFEELWKDGIDAKTRMASIEEGVDLGNIEVLPSAPRARELYSKLLEDATEEVLLLFPSINEFRRQERIITESRVLPNAESKTTSELSIGIRNIRVRILMPFNRLIQQNIQDFKSAFSNIKIRYIEPLMLTTQATILVTDRKNSLVMEIRDDSKSTFDEAIGMSTYSDSKAGVLSYVSIFENLWKQIELYEDIVKSHEQLRIHDKMQQEFINVAAHELRTPIQPIIGLSQLLLSKTGNIEQYNGFLDIIYRNANRLTRLSDDILDVAKIESKSLGLKKVQFNLNDVIGNAMDDIVLSKDFNSKNLQLSYEPRDIFLQADKSRIAQVISNLLNNALKFTSEGTITISTEKYTANKKNKDWVIVNVKDTGQGIDSSVLSRLFKKFASKSDHGTGLGLFISKGIIEAHLGKICGKNNEDGKGATFSFRIPAT